MKNLMLLFLLVAMVTDLPGQNAWFGMDGQMFPIDQYQVVIPLNASDFEMKAASEFQKYIGMMTGVTLKIVNEQAKHGTREIAIGYSGRFPGSDTRNSIDPDGFEIRIQPPAIYIAGGSHKGTLYGVYEFLEQYAGCRFWAPGAETVPLKNVILLPVVNAKVNPAFHSREVYYAGMDEQDFTDKMRTDHHAWKGGEEWGMWVHTMFTLVPPEKYFESHPEYYALMGGKRTTTQLCLTNPEVLKVLTEALKTKMTEKPGAKYWSVSQMDTFGSCECDACKTIDDHEGSSSGSMISFVNQVAAAFPDKVISTLAYQYTRKAPKHIKPAPNVNIMLCTIECDRSRPLETDTTTGSFVDDLRHWTAIADDILVWDYVIQFTNMIGPFPNLPVLQPNIRLFQQYRVSSVFEQGCRGTYSENQELRQYLLAKLLWNTGLNVDSLENQFLSGYYAAAGPFIGAYLNSMEAALHKSGKTLWIYGSPMQETDAFLGPENITEFNRLFDQAEMAVAGDTTLLNRVAKARLPLRYAMIEVSKKYITGEDGFMEQKGPSWVVKPAMLAGVNEFVRLANRYGVKTVHERSLPPDVYGGQTIEFMKKAYAEHLAKDKSYTLGTQPSPKYNAEGSRSLTDGKRGSANYYVLWQGFEGVDFSAVVDLGAPVTFNYAGAEFLQDLSSWIFFPKKLAISVSDDGISYREVVAVDSLSCNDPTLIREVGQVLPVTTARFVKFMAQSEKTCPDWHIGHGGKAWLFVDELIVEQR